MFIEGLRKMEGGNPSTQVPPGNNSSTYPSQSAVYAEPKGCGWGYSNRIIATNPVQGQWLHGSNRLLGGPQCTQCPGTCPVPRSSSNPGPSQVNCLTYAFIVYLWTSTVGL